MDFASRNKLPFWSLVLIAAWCLAGIVYVFHGCYVGDEGWYCLISREVWHGRALYSDIRFTQMPLLPYAYGALLQFLPPRIESGRMISLLAGLTGLLLLWRLLRERYGDESTLPALLLVLGNTTFLFDITSVRTQALSFLLSTTCLFFCHRATQCNGATNRQRNLFAAAIFASLAVATRLSLLPLCFAPAAIAALPPTDERKKRLSVAVFLLFVALALPLALTLYYLQSAGDRFFFGILNFHALLGKSLSHDSTGVLQSVLWNLLLFTVHTLPWTVAFSASLIYLLKVRDQLSETRPVSRERAFEIVTFVAWLVMTWIHVTRRPAYPTYQTPLVWAPAIVTAWALWHWMNQRQRLVPVRLHGALLAAASILILCLGNAMLLGSGLVSDRNRTPAGIYDLAAPLRHAPGKSVVTFEAGLVFCAPEIRFPAGYEMAEFSLVPPLPDDRQEYFRGVTFRKLQRDVQSADFIALRPMDYTHLHFSNPRVARDDWHRLFVNFEPISMTLSAQGASSIGHRLWLIKR